MRLTKKNFAVLEKFEFEMPPVGVKFFRKRPDGLERLATTMAFCEMLKAAQEGNAFYADAKNHTCDAGLYVLGQTEAPKQYLNGAFGSGLKIFADPRAASRLYDYIPRLGKRVANYVAFAPLDKLVFDPDVLIILAHVRQTEIILRAVSYKTGTVWSSRFSPAIGCAWIYIYPYLSGEPNYTITGLGHGMKRRKIFPEGMQIIALPLAVLPSIFRTLEEMPWVLPSYKADGETFVRKLLVKLGLAPAE